MSQADFRTALQGSNIIDITVTGRTAGRSLSYPVWFALDGDTLYLIPVKGSDTEWYKKPAQASFHQSVRSWEVLHRGRPFSHRPGSARPGP